MEESERSETPSPKERADVVLKLFSELMSFFKVCLEGYWKGITLLGGANGLALVGVLTAIKDVRAQPELFGAARSAAVWFACGIAFAVLAYASSMLSAGSALKSFVGMLKAKSPTPPEWLNRWMWAETATLGLSAICLVFGMAIVILAVR